MRFAFDVDGVITEAPRFFRAITNALKLGGHEVIILTDFDENFRSYRENELKEYGIAYDDLVITANKEKYCRENGVEFAVDDDDEYFSSSKQLHLVVNEITTSPVPRKN